MPFESPAPARARRAASLLALLALLAAPAAARAQGCPAPAEATPALAARTDAERLAFLRTRLQADADASRTWRLAWGATYALATLAQLPVASVVSDSDRPDWLWGALSTGVGVAFTLLGTPDVLDDGPAFALRSAAEGPVDCGLLAEGERLMLKDAANEADGVRWYWHAANVVFNAGVGLVLGLAYGHWLSGLVNFLVGAALGEGTLFTQPVALAGAWQQYLGGGLAAARAPPVLRLAPGQLGLALSF
jgi:hypothetical protein